MGQQIRVTVVHRDDPTLQVSVCLLVHANPEGGLRQELDADRATGYRGLSSAILQVLRSEIGAGILTGVKKAPQRDWIFELVRLTARHGEEDFLLEVPSDGFAVAACLAAAHGSGAENLEADPHGGYDWRWGGMEIIDC
jgi:hypothetical protein